MKDIIYKPIIIAGTAIPAARPIPTGAPTKVPSCQSIFFFLDHGFLPQKVQPEGLRLNEKLEKLRILKIIFHKNKYGDK